MRIAELLNYDIIKSAAILSSRLALEYQHTALRLSWVPDYCYIEENEEVDQGS